MDKYDKLEKLIKEGFAEMKNSIGDLKDDMVGMKKEINSVKETTRSNTEGLANHATEMAEVHDQMRSLIRSDQDQRRRAGRRYFLTQKHFSITYFNQEFWSYLEAVYQSFQLEKILSKWQLRLFSLLLASA